MAWLSFRHRRCDRLHPPRESPSPPLVLTSPLARRGRGLDNRDSVVVASSPSLPRLRLPLPPPPSSPSLPCLCLCLPSPSPPVSPDDDTITNGIVIVSSSSRLPFSPVAFASPDPPLTLSPRRDRLPPSSPAIRLPTRFPRPLPSSSRRVCSRCDPRVCTHRPVIGTP